MEKKKYKSSLLSIFEKDIVQELFYSALGCGFFVLLYLFFPKHYWNKFYRSTIILILSLAFFLVFIFVSQIGSNKSSFKISYKKNIILFTVFNFSIFLFLFYHTNWGYNGLAGDNIYRTAYVTHMAHSGYPQDFAYKGYSAFYSPLYWYSLALLSILLNIAPYKMLRIGMLITIFFSPIILYESWKKIYDEKISFVISIMSSIYFINIYSPDHMLGSLFIIPYFIYYFENYTNKTFTKKDYIIGGFLGALILCTYFLYFVIIPIYYLISFIQNKNKFRKNLRHLFYISVALLLFSSWFWVPLAKDILLIGFESHQNNYFDLSMFQYPLLNYFGFGIYALYNTIGIVYIIRKYNLTQDMRILGNLLIAIHFYFLLGFICVMNNISLMYIRIMPISAYILMISSSIFYVRFFIFIKENDFLKKNKIKADFRYIEIFLLISITIVQTTGNLLYIANSDGYKAAKSGNSMSEEVRDIIEELDYEDKVFLIEKWEVAMFMQIYLFLLPNPYYNHPSALYNERVKFLIELSECESSKEFYDKIMDNKFGPIDYFYLDLEDNSTKLVLQVAIEKFPDGRDYYDIEFNIELFENENLFERIEIDGELIYKTKY